MLAHIVKSNSFGPRNLLRHGFSQIPAIPLGHIAKSVRPVAGPVMKRLLAKNHLIRVVFALVVAQTLQQILRFIGVKKCKAGIRDKGVSFSGARGTSGYGADFARGGVVNGQRRVGRNSGGSFHYDVAEISNAHFCSAFNAQTRF